MWTHMGLQLVLDHVGVHVRNLLTSLMPILLDLRSNAAMRDVRYLART